MTIDEARAGIDAAYWAQFATLFSTLVDNVTDAGPSRADPSGPLGPDAYPVDWRHVDPLSGFSVGLSKLNSARATAMACFGILERSEK